MNRTNFNQTGGYPLKTERLQELETAYKIFNSYGNLAGNLTIISGCELVGSTIANGYVYINGELLEFRTASVTPTSAVIIIEETVNRAFKNGVIKPVHTIRYATFGIAETSWLWTNFKRIYPLRSALMVGEMKFGVFDMNNLEWGWYYANGENGTIDMRDRFPVGYNPENPDYDTIGKTGGLKEVVLTKSQMPKHKHSMTFAELPTGNTANPGYDGGNNNYSQNANKETSEEGNNEPHENRPPFVALGFIQFKGV